MFQDELAMLGEHEQSTLLFVANFTYAKEAMSYFDPSMILKPLVHLWSLSVEEQFYLVFPLLLLFCVRYAKRLTPLLIVLITLISLSWLTGADMSQKARFYLPQARAWELLFGALLAYMQARHGALFSLSPRARDASAWLGITLILGSFVLLDGGRAAIGLIAPVVGAALLINSGPAAYLNCRLFAAPPVVYVGLISYPLYLWHWPILSLANIITLGAPLSIELRLSLVAAAILLACLTYELVERRVRRMGTVSALILIAIGILILPFARETEIQGKQVTPYRDLVAQLFAQRLASIRSGECHYTESSRGHSVDDFKPRLLRCLALSETKPNILVFGDSHAADLWAALSSGYTNINFMQATAQGCWPVEGQAGDRDYCANLVNYIKYSFPNLEKVDGLILSGSWGAGNWKSSDVATMIKGEVDYYRRKGIMVVVFGPNFELSADAPKIIYRGLARYSDHFLLPRFPTFDRELGEYFSSVQIPYISKINVLCNPQCPIETDHGVPLLMDNAHWTSAGQQVFGSALAKARVIERSFGSQIDQRKAELSTP